MKRLLSGVEGALAILRLNFVVGGTLPLAKYKLLSV
jgi:hypothetical protein